jgi:formamidopyrimidine-DNA glycosylase
MPELPDITAYIAALEPRILGATLERIRLQSVFVLRTADPPIAVIEGKTVHELRRVGKRIAIGLGSGPKVGVSDGPSAADDRLWFASARLRLAPHPR